MKYPNIKSEWREITPKQAAERLANNNPGNRPLRETTVISYARDMKNGKWSATHQGIAFNTDGNLEDGQHRLAAIVRSGCTIEMLVTTGLPPTQDGRTTKDAIDAGASRSVADRLCLSHGFEKSDARIVSAISHVIAQICCDESGFGNLIRKISIEQTLAIIELYSEDSKYVIKHRPMSKGIGSAQVLGAVTFAHFAKTAASEEFLGQLRTGENLLSTNPILHLRNTLIEHGVHKSVRRAKRQRVYLAELTLQALWLFLNGTPTTKLDEGTGGLKFFKALQLKQCDAVAKIFSISAAAPEAPIAVKTVISTPPNAKPQAVQSHSMARIVKAVEKKSGIPEVLLFRKKSRAADVELARWSLLICAKNHGYDVTKMAFTFGWTIAEIGYELNLLETWLTDKGNAEKFKFELARLNGVIR